MSRRGYTGRTPRTPLELQQELQRLGDLLQNRIRFRNVVATTESLSPSPEPGDLWIVDDPTQPYALLQLSTNPRLRARWNVDFENA